MTLHKYIGELLYFAQRILRFIDKLTFELRLRLSKENNSFYISYSSKENEFAYLCHKFGTDKGNATKVLGEHSLKRITHNYSDFYDFIFSGQRDLVQNVFECGIGTNNENLASNMGSYGVPAASLRVWREFFPNASIFGADIDSQCLFEEERIRTYYVDQTDPKSISFMWSQLDYIKFDLIIDDGLHTFNAGKTFFENSIYFLSDFGFYIIEDVLPWDTRLFKKYFENKLEYKVYFVHLLREQEALADNSLVVIQKVISRKS